MSNDNLSYNNRGNIISINSIDINSNNYGTSDYTNDSFSNSNDNSNLFSKKFNSDDKMSINIYRFKFTIDFINELFKFSKIHQYDHRKDFKEAWEVWTDENKILMDEEQRRLIELGYEGNIKDKMYKSARYYFRKKSIEKKEPIKRRNYISINKELLDSMDEFIEINIRKFNSDKPSEIFDDFCKINVDLLKESVNNLVKNGLIDVNEIKNKIKKTFKNRYFLKISNLKKGN